MIPLGRLEGNCRWSQRSDSNRRPAVYETKSDELIGKFITSRREGLSIRTIEDTYKCYLNLSREVIGLHVTAQDIQHFLATRRCSNGGKRAYHCVLRNFYNWLYGRKSGFNLNAQDNPILGVDTPKVERRILPCLSQEQLDYVIEQAKCVRDRAIVSLFADSGLRLTELAGINSANIDWQRRVIKVKCKGNKEGYAPFGSRTESLLKQWLSEYKANGRLWDLNHHGVDIMLRRLSASTGIKFSAHVLRRTFASILCKRGVSDSHIMRLGRWSSIAMVQRYTASVRFEDSLKLYSAIVS
jgi:site-specific recombinase XerD